MKPSDNNTVPFYKQRDRARTDPAEARRLRERGWAFGSKKFSCRSDWESSVLRYKGIFTLPK